MMVAANRGETVTATATAKGDGRAALLGGIVVAACVLAVPVHLVEALTRIVGLAKLSPAFASPIGLEPRIALALALGLTTAVLSWRPADRRDDEQAILGGGNDMAWNQGGALRRLIGMARGDAGTAVGEDGALPVIGPKLATHRAANDGDAADALPRHRAALHPDAPPRPPLMASRDLPRLVSEPGCENPVAVMAGVRADEASSAPATASPLPEPMPSIPPASSSSGSRPLPRSPEPLSDSDLARISGRIHHHARGASDDADIPMLPAGETAPLGMLLARFEQGLASRIVPDHAADAVQSPTRTPPSEAEAHAAPRIDPALDAALETLRRLSARAS